MPPTAPPRQRALPGRLVGPIALGTVLQALNSSMIAVALVSIAEAFDAAASVPWLIAGLYLATAVCAPAAGRLADLYGPRRVFLAGLALVAAASLAAPFAPGVGWLIGSRVLLGVGTAAQFPAGLAIIRAEADRLDAVGTRAIATLSVGAQTAVALGPAIGGLLVSAFGWPAIFLVNLPIVAVSAVCVLRWLPADPPLQRGRRQRRRLDIPGMALFGASITVLLLVLLSPRLSLLAALPLLVAALLWWERRRADPFLDVGLLAGNAALRATYLRTIATWVAFYAIFYGLPQWLERSRGLDPATVGLVILPIACLGAVTTVVASRVYDRSSVRVVLLIGATALLAGGACLTVGIGSATPIVALLAVCALLGVPHGFVNLGNQVAVYTAAPARRTGTASGLYRTSQYVGANVAAALLAVTGGAGSDAGLHRMGAAVVLIAFGLLVAALLPRRRPATRCPSSDGVVVAGEHGPL